MLRSSSEEMRGRVMGLRMLAIWGLPLGLLAAGPIIARIGYAATTLIYAGLGLAATIAIGYRWRRALWHRYEEFDDDHSDIDYRMDAGLPFLYKALKG